MDNNSTFSCQFYTGDGTKVFYTITVQQDIIAESLAFSADALARGLTHEAPGLDNSNAITIVTVVRREKGDGTPIIDFYPEWGFPVAGKETFGTYRNLGVYMNADDPKATEDFLAVSGFKSLDQIPLYESQNPLKRTEGQVHKKETKVPTPFKIIREQGEEKIGSDGKPFRPWKLVRYEAIGGQSVDKSTGKLTDKPAQPKEDKDTTWMTNQEAVKQLVSALATWSGLSATELLGNVNIVTSQATSRWSELKNITRSDVWAAVVLTRVNQDKDKALAMVSDDENKRKSIVYWADKNTDIAF